MCNQQTFIYSTKIIIIFFINIIILHHTLYAGQSVEGYWKSIDDETNKVTAYWNLIIKDNILYGYIISYPNMKPDDICVKCENEFKDKPIIGTPWLKLKKRNKKGQWEEGYIIDSGKGERYRAKLWIENGKLMMRAYYGLFYSTQEWLRATETEAEKGSYK